MKPLNEYRRNRILTASPGELIVMLYDGMLNRILQAEKFFVANKWNEAGVCLGKAQDILHELMGCLERKHAPDLADSLMNLYAYCSTALLESIATRDTDRLHEVYKLLKPLREAWDEAEQKVKHGDGQDAKVAVNK